MTSGIDLFFGRIGARPTTFSLYLTDPNNSSPSLLGRFLKIEVQDRSACSPFLPACKAPVRRSSLRSTTALRHLQPVGLPARARFPAPSRMPSEHRDPWKFLSVSAVTARRPRWACINCKRQRPSRPMASRRTAATLSEETLHHFGEATF